MFRKQNFKIDKPPMVDSAGERNAATIISKLFLIITELSPIETLHDGEITYDRLFRYSVTLSRNFTPVVETYW